MKRFVDFVASIESTLVCTKFTTAQEAINILVGRRHLGHLKQYRNEVALGVHSTASSTNLSAKCRIEGGDNQEESHGGEKDDTKHGNAFAAAAAAITLNDAFTS